MARKTAEKPRYVTKKKEDRTLPCQLTAVQLLERGRRMAALVAEIADEEEAKKAAASAAKEAIDSLDAELGRISREVSTGKEHRQVECEIRYDLELRVAETLRLDTDPPEVIHTRTLSPDEMRIEMQGKLFPAGERDAAADEAVI